MAYEFNIFYYINLYKKYGKIIVSIVLISMFLTMVSSSRKSATYVSTVTILLATASQGSTAGLEKVLGISSVSSADIIISLLNSRRMAKDIRDQFSLDKEPQFWHSISSYETGGAAFAIKVRGSDPLLIQKIADFVVVNLDKLNAELDITPNKPMVKVLDPATYGSREAKYTSRRVLLAGMFAFLGTSVYAFFSDYFRKLKSQ